VTAPNSAKPTTNPTALVTTNTRFESSRGGSTGSEAWRSNHKNTANASTPPAPSPTITGEPQPKETPPSELASTIAESPAASSAVPM